MRSIIINISNTLNRFCKVTASCFFAAMLFFVIFQVISRYIFQSVPPWTSEAARYCMVWGGLLGATVAFKSNFDPRIVQPPSGDKRILAISALWTRALAVLIFLSPVLYFSPGFLVRASHRTTQALEISAMWVSLAVPLSIVVIFCHIAAKLAEPEIDST